MIQGILLAAGNSIRFEADKRWLPLENGVPMVIQAARNLYAAVPHASAVISHTDHELAARLQQEGLQVIYNSQSEQGMGHSLSLAIASSHSAEGWVIALGDMPFIQVNTIQQIHQAVAKGEPIAAPYYHEQRGHPVGFGQTYRQQLKSLKGDQGARTLLQQEQHKVYRIDVDDPGILIDIDTREDATRGLTIIVDKT